MTIGLWSFCPGFLIHFPTPKAIRKMARVPTRPETAFDTFSFLIHGMA